MKQVAHKSSTSYVYMRWNAMRIMSANNTPGLYTHVNATSSRAPDHFWTTSVLAAVPLYATGPLYSSSKGMYGSKRSKSSKGSKSKESKAPPGEYAYSESYDTEPSYMHVPLKSLSIKICRDLVRTKKKTPSLKMNQTNHRPDTRRNTFKSMDNIRKLEQMKLIVTKTHRNFTELVSRRNTVESMLVNLDFKIKRSAIQNIHIQVKDDLGNAFIIFHREDIQAKRAEEASAPLNWIATIPLDWREFPTVTLIINGTREYFATNKEIYEFTVDGNILACLIFKHVPQSTHDNWCIKETDAVGCRAHLFLQFNLLEDFLNSFLEKKTPRPYEQILDKITTLDSLIKEYELYANKFTDLLGLKASSRLLDDMTYTAKPMSLSSSTRQTIRGAITRDDVVNSIDFEQAILYANDGLEHFLNEKKQKEIAILHYYMCARAAIMVQECMHWESCHKFMVQTKIGEFFDTYCHDHLEVRISIMKGLQKLLLDTHSDTVQIGLNRLLLTQSLLCIDNSIMCNIDTLCGITNILHNICIASIEMKTLQECDLKTSLLSILDDSMKLKLRHQIHKHNNPFARITTSIAKVMFRNMFVTSMHNYLKTNVPGLPAEYCRIATRYDWEYTESTLYQYQFKNETIQIFQESPSKVLLYAYIDILMLRGHITRDDYPFFKTLSELKMPSDDVMKSEQVWPEVHKQALDMLGSVSEDGRLIVTELLHDILFDEENPNTSRLALNMIAREMTYHYV